MINSNIIELDIWSKFGCFNKPFSSGGGLLTYLIPPKTSIIGMIGAILGYPFDEFNLIKSNKQFLMEKLNGIKISIRPLFPFKTKRVTFNNVSNTIMNIQQDILINPYYKLYILFPESLKYEEKVFLDRIKYNKSFFNLYMGRNEFLLNFEFKDFLKCEKFTLNNYNSNEFFNIKKNRIYGSLNRKNVKLTKLKEENINTNRTLFSRRKKRIFKLESYYEYIVNQYPIKRTNFTNFEFSPISFYADSQENVCFFSEILFKNDNDFIDLFKIGDLKWISMI